MKARALQITVADRVELREVDVPAPGQGEVLIRSEASAVGAGSQRLVLSAQLEPGASRPGVGEVMGVDLREDRRALAQRANPAARVCGEVRKGSSEVVCGVTDAPQALCSAIDATRLEGRVTVGSWSCAHTEPLALGTRAHRKPHHLALLAGQPHRQCVERITGGAWAWRCTGFNNSRSSRCSLIECRSRSRSGRGSCCARRRPFVCRSSSLTTEGAPMFEVAVRKEFTAFHRLIGGDWGAQNVHHSHDDVLATDLRPSLVDQPSLDSFKVVLSEAPQAWTSFQTSLR